MKELKIGDVVKIRKDLKVGKIYGGFMVVPQMLKYCGKRATIYKVFSDRVLLNEFDCVWSPKMFELDEKLIFRDDAFCEIHDIKTDEWYQRKDLIVDLLNQQDKEIKQAKENLSKFGNIISEQDRRIKELKQEVNDWKQRFTSSEKWNKSLLENSVTVSELKNKKIEKLKQAQKQFAIDELEKIKKFLVNKIAEKQACFDSGCYNDFADGVKTICEILVWEIDKRVKILEEL